MIWHLRPDGPADGATNMARDLALLDLAAERGIAFVRTYAWAPFTLSFGANEPAAKRYRRDLITARGIPVVRRPTGGRAVWHAEELTYAVAAPEGALGSLAESYRIIHELLAGALTSLAPSPTRPLALSLAPAPPRALGVDAGACFASPAGGEIVSQLGKVVGSAQVRERGAFLQHGSILLGNRQELVAELTVGAPPAVEAASLADLLGRPVAPEVVAAAIAAAATEAFGGFVARDPALDEAIAVRTAMHRPRFVDDAWTWRR